jgi:hypothetical protein
MSRRCALTTKFPCLQEMPPSDPVEQDDGADWDTVGEPGGGSRSPAPTVEELLAQLERQPPVAQGSTEPAAAATEEAAAVGVLDRQTYQGGIRCSRLCGEDRDRETENSKVCTRTRDTRFIQVRAAKVANPTTYLGDQVWRPTLVVGLFRCPTRYPALVYIVQGAGSLSVTRQES